MAAEAGARKIQIVLGLDDKAAAAAWQRQQEHLKKLHSVANWTFAAMGAAMAGVVATAYKLGSAYELQMARTAGNIKATAAEFDLLNAAAKKAGRETVFGSTDAARALYKLTSSGLNAKEAVEALTPAIVLASSEMIDLEQASGWVVNTLGQFQLGTSQAMRAVNVLGAAITLGNQDANDMEEAMKYAGSSAAILGVSLEETAAMTDVFAAMGIKGSMAGTSMGQVFAQLHSRTKDMWPYLEGVNVRTQGMAGALDKMKENGLTAEKALELLGRRGGPALAVMLRTGSDVLREFTEKLTDTTFAEDKMRYSFDNLAGDIMKNKNAFKGIFVSLYDAAKPALRDGVQMLTKAFRDFANEIEKRKGEVRDFVKTALNGIIDFGTFIVRNGDKIRNGLMIIVAGLAALKAVKIATEIMAIASAIKLFLLMNPEIAVIAALAAGLTQLGFAVSSYFSKTKDAPKELDAEGQAFRKLAKDIEDTQKAIDAAPHGAERGGMLMRMKELKAAMHSVVVGETSATQAIENLAAAERQAAQETADRLAEQVRERNRILEEEEGERIAKQREAQERRLELLKQGLTEEEAWYSEWKTSVQKSELDRDLEAAREKGDAIRDAHLQQYELEKLDKIKFNDELYELESYSWQQRSADRAFYYNAWMNQEHFFLDQMVNAWQSAGSALIAGETSGRKILKSIKQAALNEVLGVVTRYLATSLRVWMANRFAETQVTKIAEAQKTLATVKGTAARVAARTADTVASTILKAKQTGEMAAAVTAYYARSGPLGIPLAAATIAAYIGEIKSAQVAGTFAEGGRIRGPGSDKSDNLLIKASPDEFIINAAAARSIGYEVLEQANRRRRLPGYQNGGVVMDGEFGVPRTNLFDGGLGRAVRWMNAPWQAIQGMFRPPTPEGRTLAFNMDIRLGPSDIERRIRQYFTREEGRDFFLELLEESKLRTV